MVRSRLHGCETDADNFLVWRTYWPKNTADGAGDNNFVHFVLDGDHGGIGFLYNDQKVFGRTAGPQAIGLTSLVLPRVAVFHLALFCAVWDAAGGKVKMQYPRDDDDLEGVSRAFADEVLSFTRLPGFKPDCRRGVKTPERAAMKHVHAPGANMSAAEQGAITREGRPTKKCRCIEGPESTPAVTSQEGYSTHRVLDLLLADVDLSGKFFALPSDTQLALCGQRVIEKRVLFELLRSAEVDIRRIRSFLLQLN